MHIKSQLVRLEVHPVRLGVEESIPQTTSLRDVTTAERGHMDGMQCSVSPESNGKAPAVLF